MERTTIKVSNGALQADRLTNSSTTLRLVHEEESSNADHEVHKGTELMSAIRVMQGDVIGIAMQQSDFPMLQIFVNGERVAEINRFRGSVYPAVYLPESASVEFVFRGFQNEPPNARFLPILEAKGLV